MRKNVPAYGMMRRYFLVTCVAILSLVGFAGSREAQQFPTPENIIDLGAPGDEAHILSGFHQREGPHSASSIPMAAENTFRWTENEFSLIVPVFPRRHNQVTFHMYLKWPMKIQVGETYQRILFGVGNHQDKYSIVIPSDVIGASEEVIVRGSATRPREPSGEDARTLFALIDRVTVRPVDRLPTEDEMMDATFNEDIPTLDRIRGVERRPVTRDIVEFVELLKAERANVVTLGAMYGSGYLFFPSQFGTPHPDMNPNWLPDVIRALRANNIKPLCWVLFNAQDVRDIEEFVPARNFPDWKMEFIEDPEREYPSKIGMCLVSSPYIEQHAKVLREAAAFDLDGFFFDGFYFGGIPHPSRPGCVCEFCEKAFAEDTGLEIPGKVDWTDMTFKRWVRWRNDRLLRTARFFQSGMREVNPDITCTFNWNIWPFGGKDWETAVPMWRIEDLGVSQHGYSPRFSEKWMILGFKCRIGRDMNPKHTDVWRACGFSHTCGRDEPDLAWHELETKTFILAALSHGITPWHSTVEGPVEVTSRIHSDVAKRERYFSRDHVCNVGVLCSQNTHDFYGHIPGTSNLKDYQDSILGTWMIFSENHVPFEFLFDNQLESRIPEHYRLFVLPKAAALSEEAMNNIADWTREGGRLIVTADSGRYDEWGEELPESRFARAFGLTLNDEPSTVAFGQGEVTWLPKDPGLAYCRGRDAEATEPLLTLLRRIALPFRVEAPSWVVVNMFSSHDENELWVHILNVSHLMPGGDSGFRGLGRPPAPAGDVSPEDTSDPSARSVGALLEPVHDLVFRLDEPRIASARLVIDGRSLSVRDKTEVLIPTIDLHDVLVLKLLPEFQGGHATAPAERSEKR